MPDLSTWRTRLSPSRPDRPVGRRPGGVTTGRAAAASSAASDPSGVVPFGLRASAAWAWRFIVVAAALAILGYLVITFQTIVVAFLLAIIIAVLLDPLAAWLRRVLRFPRALASLTAIVATLATLVALLVLAGRSIVDGFGALTEQAVAGFDQLLAWLSDGPLGIDEAQIDQVLEQVTGQVRDNSDVLINGVVNATGSLTSVLTGAVIAIFCLFFFLKEGRRIWQWFVRLAPRPARERINESGIRAWITVGGYARTQILVAFVDAVGIAAGALILGVPLALPIGVLVFLGAFIPIVGAFLTGAVAVLVALVDQGPVTGLIMFAIVLLVQQIEGNLLQPWLQGNALSLHPIAILLAVTAGTGVAGILGALLAVPVAAVLNTVLLYLNGHDKYPEIADDLNRPGGPPGAVTEAIEASYPEVELQVAEDGSIVDEEGRPATVSPATATVAGGGHPGAHDRTAHDRAAQGHRGGDDGRDDHGRDGRDRPDAGRDGPGR
ncbi:AI-2E family transporter [Georgenia muralis]|uniref:Putative PurR-regulated permease PerM n=1 Tax=Georgenia muralis TaxID=154117 RepID=A0A3N4YY17_9MICO|nr:AI-2E family transporter [Georgenia muralis]RPF26049.1 putative PurR-regulated permease PerM [Georgenia muralis]